MAISPESFFRRRAREAIEEVFQRDLKMAYLTADNYAHYCELMEQAIAGRMARRVQLAVSAIDGVTAHTALTVDTEEE